MTTMIYATQVRRYRKIALIEAMQFTGSSESAYAVCTWMDAGGWGSRVHTGCSSDGAIELTIKTLEGDHRCVAGAWIARGVNGEFWPIAADIFAKTYVLADGPS